MKSRYIGLVAAVMVSPLSATHAATDPVADFGPVEVHHDLSLPLRYLAGVAPRDAARAPRIMPLRPLPQPRFAPVETLDGALQLTRGPKVATTDALNIHGVGNGDYGFMPNSAPPDTEGSVGLTQYVQEVNSALGIFNKSTGALELAVKSTNALWSGFGGGCEANDDGDGETKYDRIANRWVITQFSVSTTPYLECVAVSQTSDATGAYYRYAFSYGNTNFPDYPKFGVWPAAYFFTYNIFKGNTFAGAMLCAMNRAAMLSGVAAGQVCKQLSSAYGGVLPADLDGAAAPPAGSSEYFVNFGANTLNLWKMTVNFAKSTATLSAPKSIAVAAFTQACNGGICVPQSGTSEKLDSLGDRLMFRLAYRNFGDHEALVASHSVKASLKTAQTGVRWYELRNPGATPTLYQSGTFAPDSTYRWMPSIGMDKVGDIAVGYSASSTSQFPSIRYSGRIPTDPLGTLETEKVVITGGGSQTTGLSRWGDYSAIAIDPVDDCTFYYTNQYQKTNGTFNWSTQINSFKFSGCS